MATAKKLPSGSWRCLVYSHTEEILQSDGSRKKKRIYESFVDDDTSMKGKRRCEKAAADWAAGKDTRDSSGMTLRQAIDAYINMQGLILSPTTVSGYKKIKKYAFADIMDKKIRILTNRDLQEAVILESQRKAKNSNKTISPKTVSNEYGLISAVLNRYEPDINCTVRLPQKKVKIKELPEPETIARIVKDTDIELPVLLSMWLSFSESEVLGLTKSKSIHGDYISVVEVVVNVDNKPVRKDTAKNGNRIRRHHIPPYISNLIKKIPADQDELVLISGNALYLRFKRLLKSNGIEGMTFHDLRHLNASIMAMLSIPDKYAQERGGWKTDHVMKKVYTHTFSKERVRVDGIIDGYFETIMQHELHHKPEETA